MKMKLVLVPAVLLFAGLFMSACRDDNRDNGGTTGDLAAYKEGAKANLTAYVETLEPDDYSDENWKVIEEITNTGKENINMAADKQGVDSALATAKYEIGHIKQREKTEEEHLETIRNKLHRRFYKDDGTFTYMAYFPDQYIDGEWIYVTVESFDVEILLSYDGIPEYFLVTYKPFAIGHIPGIIIGNEYRIFILNQISHSNNPFEENEIEKGNRFYMFWGSRNRGVAARKDGVLIDLYEGHIYSEDEIKNRLEFLRSEDGLRFTLKYSGLL